MRFFVSFASIVVLLTAGLLAGARPATASPTLGIATAQETPPVPENQAAPAAEITPIAEETSVTEVVVSADDPSD